jgi:arabinofuranan 3-O-arabinosyltransferase
VKLPAGSQELHASGAIFRPLVLRLRSPAPHPVRPEFAAAGGAVISPGTAARGHYDGIRVNVESRSWLVLGESYNRGWHASCNGHDLGAPQVVDGFANGWVAPPGCRDVELRFGPQRLVTAGYAIGALACGLLLVLLALRRSRRRAEEPPRAFEVADAPWRLPLKQALIAGVVAGAAFGFVFALRAGVLIGPAVAFLLWRGVTARALTLGAGALLAIVVPLLYVIFPGDDRGGYDTRYAIEHLGAHWVAVVAFVLLVLALARTLAVTIRPRSASGSDPSRSATYARRERA